MLQGDRSSITCTPFGGKGNEFLSDEPMDKLVEAAEFQDKLLALN